MRLRNKKTGEIYECRTDGKEDSLWEKEGTSICLSWKIDDHLWEGRDFYSLAELNAEWEDAPEEPKPQGAYYIDRDGKVVPFNMSISYPKSVFDTEQTAEIGNHFETEEEAEKAVEKLKAWKRLVNKGFRFTYWGKRSNWVGLPEVKALKYLVDIVGVLPDNIDEFRDDLDLLFGGEDETDI